MKRNVDRWLRSAKGRLALGAIFVAIVVVLGLGPELGLWEPGQLRRNLLGAARWETRPADQLQRVSLSRLGIEGNSDSFAPSITADGQFVAFLSTADNLIELDSNGYQDVFLYELAQDEITRITIGYDGSQANGASSDVQISDDGRFVVFVSEASNLVGTDANGHADVFLYDRQSGVTELVSRAPDGTQGDAPSVQPALSSGAHFVAFVSLADNLSPNDKNGVSDVYLYDRQEGTLELISVGSDGRQADDTNKYPTISASGRYVAYQSKSTNLMPDDDGNNMFDIFLRDRQEGVTELISRNVQGTAGNMESQRPSISNDGRYVAFESWASDLVEGDENYNSDVFVADRLTERIEIVSVSSDGRQADHVNGGAVISGDGRYVAYSSLAGNLAVNDGNQLFDVYLRDRVRSETQLVSMNANGQAGNGVSISPSLTTAGTYIVFDSVATDLVSDDTNGRFDVFIFSTPAPVGTAQYSVFLPLMAR